MIRKPASPWSAFSRLRQADLDRLLREAASAGRAQELEALLGFGASPAADASGSALASAAAAGQAECLAALLPLSDPLAANAKGETVLMLAALAGHEGCLALLLPGSNPDARSRAGLSAEEMALSKGRRSCAELIGQESARRRCLAEAREIGHGLAAAPAPERRTL